MTKFSCNFQILLGLLRGPASWKPAEVVRVCAQGSSSVQDDSQHCGYLCNVTSQKLAVFISDETQIRKLNFDPQEAIHLLLHFIAHGEDENALQQIVDERKIDMKTVPVTSLVTAASNGNLDAFQWLIYKHDFDLFVTNRKGRNVLQNAILEKQNKFVITIGSGTFFHKEHEDTLRKLAMNVDLAGMNLFHHIILTANMEILDYFCGRHAVDDNSSLRVVLYDCIDGYKHTRSHLIETRDNSGRTALHYATNLKRTKAAQLIQCFQNQMQLYMLLHDVDVHSEYFLSPLIAFKTKKHNILQLEPLYLCNVNALLCAATKCAAEGLIKNGLEWILDNYQFSAGQINTILMGALSAASPRRSWFVLTKELRDKYIPEMVEIICRSLQLYKHRVLWAWDGKDNNSLLPFLTSMKEKAKASNWNASNMVVWFDKSVPVVNVRIPEGLTAKEWDELQNRAASALYDKYSCNSHSRTDKQQQSIQYLITRWSVPVPPLYQLVEDGQLILLRWLCEMKKINLDAPLSDYSADHKHCVFNGSIFGTPWQFLMSIAAGSDQLEILQWLYLDYPSKKLLNRTRFEHNSYPNAVLLTAASCGSFTICKWLCASGRAEPNRVTSVHGTNALFLAVSGHHEVVAMYLTTVMDVDGTDPVHALIQSDPYYNHPSDTEPNLLRQWSNDMQRKSQYAELMRRNNVGEMSVSELSALQYDETLYEIINQFQHAMTEEGSSFDVACGVWALDSKKITLYGLEQCILLAIVVNNNCEALQWIKSSFDTKFNNSAYAHDNHGIATLHLLQHLMHFLETNQSCDNDCLVLLRLWLNERNQYYHLYENYLSLCVEMNNIFITGASVVTLEANIEEQESAFLQCEKLRRIICANGRMLKEGQFHLQVPDQCTGHSVKGIDVFKHCVSRGFTHLVEWLCVNQVIDQSVRLQRTLHIIKHTSGYLKLITSFVDEIMNCETVDVFGLTAIIIVACKNGRTIDVRGDIESAEKFVRDFTVIQNIIERAPIVTTTRYKIEVTVFDAVICNGDLREYIAPFQTVLRTAMDTLLQHYRPNNIKILKYILRNMDIKALNSTESITDGTYHGAHEAMNLRPVVVNMITTLRAKSALLPRDVHGDDDETVQILLKHLVDSFKSVLEMLVQHGLSVLKYKQSIVSELQRSDKCNPWDETIALMLIELFASVYDFDVTRCVQRRLQSPYCNESLRSRYDRIVNPVSLVEPLISRDCSQALATETSAVAVAAGGGGIVAALSIAIQHTKIVTRFILAAVIRCRYLSTRRTLIKLQAVFRGRRVFRLHRTELESKRGSWQRFVSCWGPLIHLLQCRRQSGKPFVSVTWLQLKTQYDMHVDGDQLHGGEGFNGSNHRLQALINSAAETKPEGESILSCDEACLNDTAPVLYTGHSEEGFRQSKTAPVVTDSCQYRIELSQSVEKWRLKADGRYRDLLQKKLSRLAAGDRSYAMSKRLQGCKYPLYETKLDAGMRILWTELHRGSVASILVWFVSKHDDVSSAVRLIDRSYSRMTRTPMTITGANEMRSGTDALVLRDDDVLLDPLGNCPLRIFTAFHDQIPSLASASWSPPLLLSPQQQEIQGVPGTVLLLGRSGTGKTICLCDRMAKDRQAASLNGAVLSQLFASRSKRLCEFVKSYQEQQFTEADDLAATRFMTLDGFIAHTGLATAATTDIKPHRAMGRVDFNRFVHFMDSAIHESGLGAIINCCMDTD